MKTKQESKSARVALRGAILTTHWQSFFILLIRTFFTFCVILNRHICVSYIDARCFFIDSAILFDAQLFAVVGDVTALD